MYFDKIQYMYFYKIIFVLCQNTRVLFCPYTMYVFLDKNTIFVFRQILYKCCDKMQYSILTKYYTRILILVIYIRFVEMRSLYFDIRLYTTISKYYKCISPNTFGICILPKP